MTEPLTNSRIEKLMRLHAVLMAEQSFWYDKALQEADKILCVAASDERQKLIKEQEMINETLKRETS